MNILFVLLTCFTQNFTKRAPVFLLSLVLLSMFVNPASAKLLLTQISSIYFNTPNSFVIETATHNNLNSVAIEKVSARQYKLSFVDVDLADTIPRSISNSDYDLQIKRMRSAGRTFLQARDRAEILVTYKGATATNLELNPRDLLSGYAVEYSLATAEDSPVVAQTVMPTAIELPKSEPSSHQLTVVFQSIDLSATQEFLATLNQAGIKTDLNSPEIQNQIAGKIDALALAEIASLLASQGDNAKAVSAYRRVLNIDPHNHQAKLGLARLSTDREEKLNNYLASIEMESLLSLAGAWSQEATSPEALARSLVAYQLAILKDPYNPTYRLDCARLLEAMGSSQYTLAAKRYLEAAALAKNSYLSGELSAEPILRTATEALIKVLSKQGEAELALKYCNSYLDLGFKRFINGKPIIVVIKELRQNQNPFAQG